MNTSTYTSTVKKGRKHKAYVSSWGETIPGLSRRPDGRWRNTLTNREYREQDERLAVARFRQETRGMGNEQPLAVSVPMDSMDLAHKTYGLGDGVTAPAAQMVVENGTPMIQQMVTPAVLWPWLREQLLNRPEWVAKEVGIPQLASLANFDLPKASIKLADLLKAYMEHAEVKKHRKDTVEAQIKRFIQVTGFNCLRDFTTEGLIKYRDGLVAAGFTGATIKSYMAKITAILGFGAKRGFNATEIRLALDKCSVLVAPKHDTEFKPHPISRENFHKLLNKADAMMRAALLFSLNAALYPSELLGVTIDSLDLDKGIYKGKRSKTGVKRFAVLWPETVAAIRAILTPDSTCLFPSQAGVVHSVYSFRRIYMNLRKAAGVPDDVMYNHMRDGAYSTALNAGVQLQAAQALAGHRFDGEVDNYVQRMEKMVAPACSAIYSHYGPFPSTCAEQAA